MNTTRLAILVVAVTVLVTLVGGIGAAHTGEHSDECKNADQGPAEGQGPPGFVGSLVGGVVGFLGDLFSALPVPGFVKGFFGAGGC